MQNRKPIAILAVTQITSWGMLYYAFGVLATRIQADLALSASQTFGAFSWCVLVAGLAATPVGIAIDRHGGRWIMVLGSVAAAVGLWVMASAGSFSGYVVAWSVLGVAMSLTLYEAAFATLNRLVMSDAAKAISTVTLVGGLASTVFWPLTEALATRVGWRDTLMIYAVVQVVLCMPLHFMLGGQHHEHLGSSPHAGVTLPQAVRQPQFWLLVGAFAFNAFIFSALSVHLIRVIQTLGHGMELALLLVALIGPMQVIGRLLERTWGAGTPPAVIGAYTFAALPAALLALALFGKYAYAVGVFSILYGLSNGVLTILRGTLPAAMFGRKQYGAISGALAAPALLAKASGPLVFAMALDPSGTPPALMPLAGISVFSFGLFVLAVRCRAGWRTAEA
ncbi:MFS transporter [Pseudoduganella eburnea]|uniref:MFS transporter n=1 Tax=Massilia eburnea TaxID=1776165 RepID=A0A6L6QG35_9BURK|nr:MFS transporter [Massilia eburnea]MTW10613.1 MFS transporter [Massilia eburnea]